MSFIIKNNDSEVVKMFCKKCGVRLPESSKFCPSCGEVVEQSSANTESTYQVYGSPQNNHTNTVRNNNVPTGCDDDDVQSNKVMAVLAYIGILVLIPVFMAKDSKYARFHSSQGLTLLIFDFAYLIATAIIKGILGAVLPWSMFGVYMIISTILSLGTIFFLVLAIMGIVNAVQGNEKELPIIGQIDILGKFRKK